MAGDNRTMQLQQLAAHLDMQFFPEEEWGVLPFLKDFKLFKIGTTRRIANVLHKPDAWLETDVRIFDYRYTIHAGNSHKTYRQTVFFVQSKRLGLPHFWMKPETFFHKIGQWLGMKDIDFAEHPEFSNRYYLKGEDEEYIRATMNDDVLRFFSIEKGWSLEGVNYYMVLYKSDHLMSPKEISELYLKGLRLCELLEAEPI